MIQSTATRRPAGTATDSRRRSGRGPSLADQRLRRQRRLRRLRRALCAGVAAALAITLCWLVWFSSVLATEKVAVSGTKLLSVDGVTSAAAVPVGLPLARQDTSSIADRVSALPPVDTVAVDRSWPNTVSITVVERTPLVAVRTASGYLLVDHTGVAFETVSRLPAGVVQVGIDAGHAALLAEAGAIVTAVPAELRAQIATITATTSDSFRVKLDSGLVVVWGDADQSALKGQVAMLLLKKKPKAIDVSAPHSPAIR